MSQAPSKQTELNQPIRPDPLRDVQLLVVLVATVLIGIGLWYSLPYDAVADVVASPLLILSVLLLYPLVEEFLFRGVIQGALLSRPSLVIRNLYVSRANLITSIFFVALHLLNHPPSWALAVLVPSLTLGHIRERYQNLLAPIILHIFFNATYLFAAWL